MRSAILREGEPEILSSRVSSDGPSEDALNILLVEDDYGDMLMTLQAINAIKFPYEVQRITNGDDVIPYLLNAAQEKLPDLILLDMGLPGTDGFEILEKLSLSSALLRSVPIAIVTMHTNFDYLDKTYDLPIYGYLTKPVDTEKMRSIFIRVSGEAQTLAYA